MTKRGPDERVNQAYELYKQGLKLVEIASQLNIPEGTVRSWKNRNKWDTDNNATLQNNKCNVAKKDKAKNKAVAKEVKQVIDNPDLTDKQRLFCLYFIKSFNATKAYQKAYGCDYNTAASISYRLLENVGVKNEINRLKQDKLNQAFLKPEDIFQKYMDIAYSDMTDYVKFGREEVQVMGAFGPMYEKAKEDEEPIPVTKIINTVKFKESTDVDGTLISEVKQGKDGASIKLLDKMKALQWLTDHMDMATEKQRAEIALLRAKVNSDDSESTEDDGFVEALKGQVDEVWQE